MSGMFSHTPDSAAASERCSFQLTYERADARRFFAPGVISGPDIADAFGPDEDGDDRAPGSWDNGDDIPGFSHFIPDELQRPVSFEEWVDHYFTMAITEATHEALEWFQFDGEPFLDPHGPAETKVYDLTREFTEKLIELRKKALLKVDRSRLAS